MVAESSLPTSPTPPPTCKTSQSLCIPIKSSSVSPPLFIEIFPHELPSSTSTPTSTLTTILSDESAPLSLYTHASLLYAHHRRFESSSDVLASAAYHNSTRYNDDEKVRLFAAQGIAVLSRQNYRPSPSSSSALLRILEDGGGDSLHQNAESTAKNAEYRATADELFTKATRLNQLFPMTWIGQALLNLTSPPDPSPSTPSSSLPLERARHFLHAALSTAQILPALLGMALVHYRRGEFGQAAGRYETAIRLFPEEAGSGARVGLGMACYRMGMVDRARACFRRAVVIGREEGIPSIEGMVGLAVLDMSSLDREYSKDYRERMERVVRLVAMAASVGQGEGEDDEGGGSEWRENAMVRNHLAVHVMQQFTVVAGVTVGVVRGERRVVVEGEGGGVVEGDQVRIGVEFRSDVVEEEDGEEEEEEEEGREVFWMRDVWRGPSASGLKLYKKNHTKVQSLATTALHSTTVPEIQAESLLLLARVHHARDEMPEAKRHYAKAVELSPTLIPARYGLAQTLIWDGGGGGGEGDEDGVVLEKTRKKNRAKALIELQKVLESNPRATDAHAALGLLLVSTSSTTPPHPKKPPSSSSSRTTTTTTTTTPHLSGLTHLRKAIELDPTNPDLILLEALALQQREVDYPLALVKYQKAVDTMESNGEEVKWEVSTNMGVLCHGLKKWEEAAGYYVKALEALDDLGGEGGQGGKGGVLEEDWGGCVVREEKNRVLWDWVGVGVSVLLVEGGTGFVWEVREGEGGDADGAKYLKVGDHVQVGDNLFHSSVEYIEKDSTDKVTRIRLKDRFVPTIPPPPPPNNDKMSIDPPSPHSPHPLRTKRTNHRLSSPPSISILFNLARLHEASGHPIPAVELHKAILRRHPSYINSYLRLGCISRDCGSLPACSKWLSSACAVQPENPEVLCLVGNLHLSLCDWEPAQKIFDQLLRSKLPSLESYSMLCLGNIYFSNIKNAKDRYAKHLEHASRWYTKILTRDPSNAYAANGLGTVLAERGELLHAKEVFVRVREVSGDTVPDALLNLGHIYLALNKHPEALQMYRSYRSRTTDDDDDEGSSSSKKKMRRVRRQDDDDDAKVLLYIAFSYFDWARQTESLPGARAAPADEYYRRSISCISRAIEKRGGSSRGEDLTLRYDWCVANMTAAHCVLKRQERGIRRTAKEVQQALDGLRESLPKVKAMIQWKGEGKKVPIPEGTMKQFVANCQQNISTAELHLSQELRKEADARATQEQQARENQIKTEQRELEERRKRERKERMQMEIDRRARNTQMKVEALRAGWDQQKRREEVRKRSSKPNAGDDEFIDNKPQAESSDESSDDGGGGGGEQPVAVVKKEVKKEERDVDMSDASDDEDDDDGDQNKNGSGTKNAETEQDLFGSDDSDDDSSDEELVPSSQQNKKRQKKDLDESSEEEDGKDDAKSNKKRKVMALESESESESESSGSELE